MHRFFPILVTALLAGALAAPLIPSDAARAADRSGETSTRTPKLRPAPDRDGTANQVPADPPQVDEYRADEPRTGEHRLAERVHEASAEGGATFSVTRAADYGDEVQGHGQVGTLGAATTASVSRKDRKGTEDLGTVPVATDGTFQFSDTPTVSGPATYTVTYDQVDGEPPATLEATTAVYPVPYDVNGDGHAETVIGVPGEDLGEDANAGMFHVLYGGDTGVRTTGSLAIHQDTAGVPGSAEDGDFFGYSNASGDVNGDGFADVVVSAGADNIGSYVDGGSVWIFYGSDRGLRTDNSRAVDIEDVPIPRADGAFFGDALAAGDFDADGLQDFAIGAAWAGSGHVVVWYGDAAGGGARMTGFDQNDTEPSDSNHDGDGFGWSVTAGDVNADGSDELAVGAMFDSEDLGGGRATGSVTLLYGGVGGVVGVGAERWTKQSPNVPGDSGGYSEADNDDPDRFGYQVALADFTGDGAADLAVGADGAPVDVDGVRKRDAGTVTVLYSDGTALTTTGAVEVTQQTVGMPGVAGQHDYLGATMTAGDSDGNGLAELAVFSPGDGYVAVVPGADTGLAYDNATAWTQNTDGIPGSGEPGDWWGLSLRFADVKGTDHATLIVGADGENDAAGAFTAIYSGSSGLTSAGSRYFSQATDGISGDPEPGDGFGVFY